MKKLMAIAVAIVLILTMAVGVPVAAEPGNVLHVPSEFPTIQAAINAATSGDTVLVAPGTYTGVGNRDIHLKSGVVVQGAETDVTIIDCEGSSRAVVSYNADSTAKLDGFTITGGYAFLGGGIYIYNGSSPVISNCIFSGNSATLGGGIAIGNASPTVTNCTFLSNSAMVGGGGIYNNTSSPTVTNCTFVGNLAPNGGGIYNLSSSPMVTNCTFVGNSATSNGGGMYNDNASPMVTNCTFSGNSAGSGTGLYNFDESSPTVTNCILWDNGGEIYNYNSAPVVTYCDIQGGYVGAGNILQDPMFVNPAANDYHLQPGSLCIDAGNNDAAEAVGLTTDFEGDPRIWPEGGVVDMGVDEFVPNQPPVADAGGPYPGSEGSLVTFDASASSDPDGDPLQYRWDFDNDGIWDTGWLDEPTAPYAYDDDYTGDVKLEVSDGELTGIATASVTVNNVAPTVGPITVQPDPAVIGLTEAGASITTSATFTDPGTLDTHTAEWNWNDNNTSSGTATDGTISGSHTYTAVGVYTVSLTVTDDDGGSGESSFEFVVVYDPSAGFVTGGGWIDSPEGAYTADPSLTGKANFGFVSKYKKGANTPSGNTEFQFKVANLNFHSTSYQWLVVNQNGTDAQFKGTGTINGTGEYKFMLWAGDGAPDTFRIKIWEEDESGVETVIYDNGINQPISGGSIVIHK